MKRFTDFEKAVIRSLLELEAEHGFNVIANIWEKLFPNRPYYIDVSNPKAPVLMIRSDALAGLDNFGLDDMLSQLTRKTDSLVSLLNYLEANGCIKFVGSDGPNKLGQLFEGAEYAAYHLNIEPEVFQPLAMIAKRRIMVQQSLIDLVENGFRTDDELKLDEQIRANRSSIRRTQLGLFIAALGLAITASDTIRKWCHSESRVVIVNSDRPGGEIPIPVRLVPSVSSASNSPARLPTTLPQAATRVGAPTSQPTP